MVLKNIYTYPLKSSKAIAMESVDIVSTGIKYDRSIVIINKEGSVITGRDFPEITTITATIDGEGAHFTSEGLSLSRIALPKNEKNVIEFKLFRNSVTGVLIDAKVSDWISDIIGVECRVAFVANNYRPIDPKRGGKKGDVMGYADASPIHLISEESLKFLNKGLNKKVTSLHFRPNLVVSGNRAFDEDSWKRLLINGCEFIVQHKCKRCIFTTIDPISALKDANIEPLSTLARFRKERNEELTFGIYLIPRKLGKINIGDTVIANL